MNWWKTTPVSGRVSALGKSTAQGAWWKTGMASGQRPARIRRFARLAPVVSGGQAPPWSPALQTNILRLWVTDEMSLVSPERAAPSKEPTDSASSSKTASHSPFEWMEAQKMGCSEAVEDRASKEKKLVLALQYRYHDKM
jgi:hypothetical protein